MQSKRRERTARHKVRGPAFLVVQQWCAASLWARKTLRAHIGCVLNHAHACY